MTIAYTALCYASRGKNRSSADDEIARNASRWFDTFPPKEKFNIFHSQWDSGSQDATIRHEGSQMSRADQVPFSLQYLFHRRTRASYVYNGFLAWYNVVLTHGSTQA